MKTIEEIRLRCKWRGMRFRCYSRKSKNYKHYGQRGIKMCGGWRNSFRVFYEWAMSHGYILGLTLERINVNGNYEPLNCTFIPMHEQAANKTTRINITIDGITHSKAEWSKISGLSYRTIDGRIKAGKIGIDIIKPHQQNIAQMAREMGISPEILHGRRQNKWDLERLYIPKISPRKLITIDEDTKSYSEWAKSIGITKTAFSYRVKMGKTGKELLSPSCYKYKRKFIEGVDGIYTSQLTEDEQGIYTAYV